MRARSMKVIDMAVRHVETIDENVNIRECAKVIRTRHVGSLVVIGKDGKPVGMITDRDITCEAIAMGRDVDQCLVRDIMSKPVVVARIDDDMVDALARMRESGIRRLPVVDENGVLTGVITNSNMLEMLSMMLDSMVRNIRSSKTRETAQRP